MSNIWKFILLAVGCLLVVGLVTLSTRISKKGETDTEKNLATYDKVMSDADFIEIKSLDGVKVQGSEVKGYIKDYAGDNYLSIKVINGKANTSDYIHASTIASNLATIGAASTTAISTNPADAHYINDTGSFLAKVYYDQNDIIACLQFTQQ